MATNKTIDDDRWWNLVTGKDFQVVREYLEQRKDVLTKENTEHSQDQTFSTLIKIGANLARINEIDALLKRANFKYIELSKGRN